MRAGDECRGSQPQNRDKMYTKNSLKEEKEKEKKKK